MDITFEDAPPARGGGMVDPREREFAQVLRENPGKTARFFRDFDKPKTASITARVIREGKRSAFGSGFTAVSRTVDGKGRIWVTFTGN